MIGYYIHHVGQGHLQRAEAIAGELHEPVSGLSSLPRPAGWRGPWVRLPRDDADEAARRDPTAGGALHWAPLYHQGLQDRMSLLADWIAGHRPRVIVVDLSAEVSILSRLCGVPVVSVVLPGVRADDAHQLAFRLSDALLAPWPNLDEGMCVGLGPHRHKVRHVGGLSRYDQKQVEDRTPTEGVNVLALGGLGGGSEARRSPRLPPHWTWTERGRGSWTDDLWPDLHRADVVISHAGLGALADAAAARKPIIVIPERRPHDEQVRTAAALRRAGMGVVLDGRPAPEQWPALVVEALAQDSGRWATRWSTGAASARSAELITDVADGRSP